MKKISLKKIEEILNYSDRLISIKGISEKVVVSKSSVQRILRESKTSRVNLKA
jgi:response regulator of citrate/malate metabolism